MSSDPYRSDPSILTPEDVAKTLQISKAAVSALIHNGDLASFRRGRHFCIRKADLETYQTQLEKHNATDKFDIELPQAVIDSFARHLASEIRKYYDSEEGQAAWVEWQESHKDT